MKNVLGRIIATVLALMLIPFSSVSAFAATYPAKYECNEQIETWAGTETFYKGTGFIGSFYLEDHNLTPVKTMGEAGTFELKVQARGPGHEQFKVYVELREYPSGDYLCSATSMDDEHGGLYTINTPRIQVGEGMRIQIYMTYLSAPSSPAGISMGYRLY